MKGGEAGVGGGVGYSQNDDRSTGSCNTLNDIPIL